ncbi:MAG: hypothetical protein NTV23_02275 [Propionibacteriales bacterium]|nr:hypothetical protein [Propionibacteriales bacterium]
MTAVLDTALTAPAAARPSTPAPPAHHHVWELHETVDAFTGVPLSWFECEACGTPYA